MDKKIDDLMAAIDPFEECDFEATGAEIRRKLRFEVQRFRDSGVFASRKGRRELIRYIGYALDNELTTFEHKVLERLLKMATAAMRIKV